MASMSLPMSRRCPKSTTSASACWTSRSRSAILAILGTNGFFSGPLGADIHGAGKRVREDFMNFVWINDVLIAGARQLLDPVAPESRKGAPQDKAQGVSMAASGGSADD